MANPSPLARTALPPLSEREHMEAAPQMTIDPDQISTYLDCLFQNHNWQADEFLLIRGVGEKGTPQEGVFAEDQPLQPGLYNPCGSIAAAAERYSQHNIGTFIVPAVLSAAKATEENVKLLPMVLLDLDSIPAWEAVEWLTETIGEPTMIVASGGRNDHGPKLHVYYILDEPRPAADVVPLAVAMADLLGSDQIFMRRTQPIRVPGSIHMKGGEPKEVKVERWNTDTFSLDEIRAKIEAAAPSPWANAKTSMSHRAAGVSFSPASSADSNALLTTTITSGGGDGITRFDAFSRVAGHYLHVARQGSLNEGEAYQALAGWAAAHLSPAWPDERVRKEWQVLHDREIQSRGPFPEVKVYQSPPDASAWAASLRDKLTEWAFDHTKIPERPIAILRLGKWTISTAGNLTVIQAPIKAGKTAVISAIIGAGFKGLKIGPDCLGFSAHNPEGKAQLHLDTEQSRYDADAIPRRAMRRGGVEAPPSWFYSFCLTAFDISERLDSLDLLIQEAKSKHGGIFCIIIDGVADFCSDPNDAKESFALVAKLASIATIHECAVIVVIHENPGSEAGKTRGHLGSQLERKAETPLRLAKDSNGITTMWSERCRHNHIPQNQGVCFKYSEEAGMHISCGSSQEIKASVKRSKFIDEAERAFDDTDGMTYTDFVARIMAAALPNGMKMAKSTAENRVTSYAAEGVILRRTDGIYALSPALPSTLDLPSMNPSKGQE